MARYRFIHTEKANHSIVMMCRILEVSRSGYYSWRERRNEPAIYAVFDLHVRAAFRASYGRYGSRRIQRELQEDGVPCSRYRVVASMRRSGLYARGRRRFKATTDSRHRHPIAPNLLERDFSPAGPNQAWVGDITYIPTRQGWLYLAVLVDLWSRRVVGYATSARIDRHLVLDALKMAQGLRRPAPGLVHHTDRGSQYASNDYRAALDDAGLHCSMSRKGDCWDNAPAESFFSTIKTECLHRETFVTRAEATETAVDYIRWYNATRRHSTIGLVSPAAYEAFSIQQSMAA